MSFAKTSYHLLLWSFVLPSMIIMIRKIKDEDPRLATQ